MFGRIPYPIESAKQINLYDSRFTCTIQERPFEDSVPPFDNKSIYTHWPNFTLREYAPTEYDRAWVELEELGFKREIHQNTDPKFFLTLEESLLAYDLIRIIYLEQTEYEREYEREYTATCRGIYSACMAELRVIARDVMISAPNPTKLSLARCILFRYIGK